ncbi:hypothetical protein NAH39_12095, partial [Francisella tularensis subsp. holarctica]|nr:hypothetical protein [Francisella tularensis subsp. holarctica]
SHISHRWSTTQLLKYSNDIKDLLLHDKLAEVFKVMAFSLDFDVILEVFDNQDNIDYLLYIIKCIFNFVLLIISCPA